MEYKVQKFKGMNGEQQATISALKEENEQLKSRVDFLEDMCLDILIVLTKDDKLIVKK